MHQYFNINYEFDKAEVDRRIEQQIRSGAPDYICVADGVILNTANRKPDYLKVINGGMFAICDSGYVPLYLKWIYGMHVEQYTGSQIFEHIVRSRKYRMYFMGTSTKTLEGLRQHLLQLNPDVADMTFDALPFRRVEDFDYEEIARKVEADGADIIWVSLGAPKQEYFMSRLKPHLKSGVMIAVGAAFKFYSGGVATQRAPQWMIDAHLEFVHRIVKEPKKQIKRCSWIVAQLPSMMLDEWKKKRKNNRKARKHALSKKNPSRK